MENNAIKREMWDGKIPVCFKLDDDDVIMTMRGDRVAPEPCYVSGFTCDGRWRRTDRFCFGGLHLEYHRSSFSFMLSLSVSLCFQAHITFSCILLYLLLSSPSLPLLDDDTTSQFLSPGLREVGETLLESCWETSRGWVMALGWSHTPQVVSWQLYILHTYSPLQKIVRLSLAFTIPDVHCIMYPLHPMQALPSRSPLWSVWQKCEPPLGDHRPFQSESVAHCLFHVELQ